MCRRSVRMRVKKLQKLIPLGQGLNPDRLLLRTADYILLLRLQINVLQTLSQLSDSLIKLVSFCYGKVEVFARTTIANEEEKGSLEPFRSFPE
ncbi:hypothetical protein Sango_1079700 [Sesamum angolense]|uniref:Uncharacterized protein n=1 Tax=Sesamum angolense TaxID=2727404 RepID=A0AAE1WUL6_9LAMI|nr:hypothetical protein Sango_1079700 [Sesamum angolense]